MKQTDPGVVSLPWEEQFQHGIWTSPVLTAWMESPATINLPFKTIHIFIKLMSATRWLFSLHGQGFCFCSSVDILLEKMEAKTNDVVKFLWKMREFDGNNLTRTLLQNDNLSGVFTLHCHLSHKDSFWSARVFSDPLPSLTASSEEVNLDPNWSVSVYLLNVPGRLNQFNRRVRFSKHTIKLTSQTRGIRSGVKRVRLVQLPVWGGSTSLAPFILRWFQWRIYLP